jgi:hypothetical protein
MTPEQKAKHDRRQAEIDAMKLDANEKAAERKKRKVNTLSASKLMNMHFDPVNYIVPNIVVEDSPSSPESRRSESRGCCCTPRTR